MAKKKIVAGALALTLSLSLYGCGSDKAKKEADSSSETKVEESKSSEVKESVESKASEDKKQDSSMEIELGKEIAVGDYAVTVQSYQLAKDYDGNDALVINYDWKNNSEESISPSMSLNFKAYQDSVETDISPYVEDVDLAIGQKDVKPGGEIKGVQTVVSIEDISKPLELELDELLTLKSNPYAVTLDLSTLQ